MEFSIILLTVYFIIKGVQSVEKLGVPPKLNVIAPQGGSKGNGDVDFQNSTLLVMSNSFVKVFYTCTSNYPIQIIPSFDELDDGQGISTRNATIIRQVSDFYDISSYVYKIQLLLEFHGKITSDFNVSCHGTKHPYLSRTSQIFAKLSKNRFEQSVHFISVEDTGIIPRKTAKISNECSLTINVLRIYQRDIPNSQPFDCVHCTDLQGAPAKEDIHQCYDPIQCSTYFQARNLGTKCLKKSEIVATNATMNELREKFQNIRCIFTRSCSSCAKTLVCKHFGLINSQLWIPSLATTKIPTHVAPKEYYFSEESIDDRSMLLLSYNNDNETVYLGQSVTLECQVSVYLFAQGALFGHWRQNDSRLTIVEPTSYTRNKDDGFYTITTELKIQTFPNLRVLCLAPVWNDSNWFNATVEIPINSDPTPPMFDVETNDAIDSSEDIHFVIGEINKTIDCFVRSNPPAITRWITDKKPAEAGYEIIPASMDIVDDGISVVKTSIRFYEIGNTVSGKYICEASNFLMSNNHTFVAYVEASTQTGTALLSLIIFVIIILFLIPIILYRAAIVIHRQKSLIRKLTSAEINEFFQGHPQRLRLYSNDMYINSPDLIQCLPYVFEKFELPQEAFNIDKSSVLGAGQYGVVYKAILKREGNDGKEDSIIAVKTVHEDVDVVHFKMMLSELKIMAHLGKSESVVSLVAAHTTQIENRMILIGLEYCEKGCLRNFIIENRHNFKNFKKMRRTGSGNDNEDNDTIVLYTSNDFVKWTMQIAVGMQYLVSKKVIHGDLACRNILLTKELNAKISDFGLSKQIEFQGSTYVKKTQVALPYKWMAIESLQNMEFSIYSDIWAYGVTIWEIFSFGAMPYGSRIVYSEFVEQIVVGLRLPFPRWCPDEIYDYMLCSWDSEPKARQPYEIVISICKNILNQSPPSN